MYWCIYISVSEHFGWVKTWILLFISSRTFQQKLLLSGGPDNVLFFVLLSSSVSYVFVLFLCSTCICLVSVLPKYFWTCRLLGFHSTSLAADDIYIYTYIQSIHIILISFSVVGFSLQSLPCLFLHDKANSKSFKFKHWMEADKCQYTEQKRQNLYMSVLIIPYKKVLK